MKNFLKGRCGCFFIGIGIFLLLIAVAILQKSVAQSGIEEELVKNIDSLNTKLGQAGKNEKEKEILLQNFLNKDRADFNRVNLMDNSRRKLFDEIHQVLADYNLLLRIKTEAPEVKVNEKYLTNSLLKAYGYAETIMAEAPEHREISGIEMKILERYERLLKRLKEN